MTEKNQPVTPEAAKRAAELVSEMDRKHAEAAPKVSVQEKCPKCGAEWRRNATMAKGWEYKCGSVIYADKSLVHEDAECLRRRLAASEAARQKAEAEVERLRGLLAPPGYELRAGTVHLSYERANPKPCRPCVDCQGMGHHWMLDTAWVCKHCDAVLPYDPVQDVDAEGNEYPQAARREGGA